MTLVSRARSRATRRKLDFTLTWQHVAHRLVHGRCELTGLQFQDSPGQHRTNPYAPSLDRTDSALGYHNWNVRVVLWAVNAARGEWGDEVFHTIATAYARKRHEQ